jgi:transcriptional regulator with XRE-family HTH domain
MTNKQFSERIKQLRIERGFSQSDLAEKTGLTTRSIQRLEKGENQARGDTVDRLARAFEVKRESLLVKTLADSLLFQIILSLSPLVFLINPLLGVVLPFFLWLVGRKRILNVDSIGRRVMNFQISWVLIYYVVSIIIISISVGKIALSGQISLFELNEILYLQIIRIVMYVINISLILLSTYFVIGSGNTKVLFGFVFHRQKINPFFLVIYGILLIVVFTNQYFPKKDLKEKPKEEIVEFAKEVIFIPLMEDFGHSEKLKQFLHPAMDSSIVHSAAHQQFIPWGKITKSKNEATTIADYEVSKSGENYSYFLQIYYNASSTFRIQRYLFEIQELNGRLYIVDYFSETVADSFFEKVELKRKKGELFWKVSGPMGVRIFKNNKLKTYGRMNYRKLKKAREEQGYLFRMQDGKLKKVKMKNNK